MPYHDTELKYMLIEMRFLTFVDTFLNLLTVY